MSIEGKMRRLLIFRSSCSSMLPVPLNSSKITSSILLPVSVSAVPIVAVCCEQAPQSHVAALRARSAHVHLVSCVGNLHTSVVERFIRGGASGVFIAGCPPRDCVSREGPKWLYERLFNDREAELQARVDRRRVRVGTLAPGVRGEAIAAFDAFARELALLDRPVAADDAEPDLLCDPVPDRESPA